MAALFPILLAVAAAGIGLVMYLAHQARKRREALQAFAAARGWRFVADRSRLPEDFADFPPFKKGSNRYAYNHLTGEVELSEGVWAPARAGDYHYQITRNNGKSSSTTHYNLSYLAVRIPDAPAPKVAIRREHFFDSVSAAMGFDDIDFESAEFSRKFHVSSSDKRFAYDLLHPRTIEMLLRECPQRVDLAGAWLVVTDGTRRWKPPEFQPQIDWTRDFLSLWPRHLARSPSAPTALPE